MTGDGLINVNPQVENITSCLGQRHLAFVAAAYRLNRSCDGLDLGHLLQNLQGFLPAAAVMQRKLGSSRSVLQLDAVMTGFHAGRLTQSHWASVALRRKAVRFPRRWPRRARDARKGIAPNAPMHIGAP
jgi:hypothetical protein